MLALSQSAELVRFNTEAFRRELDPATREVREDQRRSGFDLTDYPFRSVPVEELENKGYVRVFPDSTVYYAPDASVLLSDAFLDSHCFRIESRENSSLVGLAFRPAHRVARPDIAGMLWLDRKTSELRSVDFHYVGHLLELPDELLGGHIEFERVLPSGAWIVRRWVIRMPVVAIQRIRWENPSTHAAEVHTEMHVSAVVEEGGEVVAVSSRASRPLHDGAPLTGTVVDSLTGGPLVGAVVYVSGTSFADTTDAAGEYRIADLPAGRYVISFKHPKLRALGILPSPRPVEITPPAQATVDLAVPSPGTVLKRYCPAIRSEQEGMLAGFVKDRATGTAAPGALVRIEWTADGRLRAETLDRRVSRSGDVKTTPGNAWLSAKRRQVEVTAEDDGFFRVCGVPLDSSVDLEARVGRSSSRRSLRLDRDRLSAQNLTVDVR